MKVNSQELIQSYVLTTAKYDFSVYEKRILYRLVEIAQMDLKGKKLNKSYTISETLFKDKIITMPINAFLSGEKDKNYARAKKGLVDLESKWLEYEDSKIWTKLRIIQKPVIHKYSDTVEFEVQPMIWKAILNFAKGFSKFELKTAMEFDSVYAMRFYELFSNNKRPITFSIEQLKERFKIEHKYNRPSDFIKRVILSAKKELDNKSPFSFEYAIIKTGRKITAIKFFPFEISKNKNEEIEQKRLELQNSSSWELPREIVNYLKDYGFEEKGIRSNINLFKTAYKEFDLLGFLAKLKPIIETVENKQGYAINSIKNYLKSKEG